tara:strand:+ start:61 stop:327 length:267 start_codon:yes stop_codon:yes gene_type:complete
MESPFKPINKELGNVVHNDGTIQVTETYTFNTHEELEELKEYLESLDNQEYKKIIYLRRKEVELLYFVDYFQHIELNPEFKIKGDEEE